MVQQVLKNVVDYADTTVSMELAAAQTFISGFARRARRAHHGDRSRPGRANRPGAAGAPEHPVTPFVESLTTAVGGLLYPVFGVVQRGVAAISGTVDLAVALVNSVITNAGLVATAVGRTFTGIVDNLGDGNFEGAWNFAVNGFLGIRLPNADGSACTSSVACAPAIPAQLIRSTIGAQANWPFDAGIKNSLRATITGGFQSIAQALAAPVDLPGSVAAVRQAGPGAAQASAGSTAEPLSKADIVESVTVDAAPAKVTVGTDNDSGDGSDTGGAASSEDTAKKPAKHRVSRKAG